MSSNAKTMKSAGMRERLRIGKEIKQRLDAIIPEDCRIPDAKIAEVLGISPTMVTRIELLALYKIRTRLQELFVQDGLSVDDFSSPAAPAQEFGRIERKTGFVEQEKWV